MSGFITHTKDLISLAGKLDFTMRMKGGKDAEKIITEMRSKLTRIQTFLKEHEVVND